MSIIDDFKKLAQSFVTLDDVVLGGSLAGGGLGRIGRVGLSRSGPSVAANVAARAVCLGVQLGTRSVEKAADTVTGIIPLADETKALAEKAGEQAKALGERCSALAVHGVELAAGVKPRNPITSQVWLGKQAPQGYTAGELAADTTFGTLQDLAVMPFALGMEVFRMADGAIGGTAETAVDSTVGAIPGGSDKIDEKTHRTGLIAVTMGSGMSIARAAIALAEAAARLTLADYRSLHEALKSGVEQARLLADQEPAEAVSGVPVNEWLRDAAKMVADNPPENFMAALEKGADGRAPSPGAIIGGMIKDSRALVTFFTVYPSVLGLLNTDLSVLLTDGLAGLRGTEAFIRKEEGQSSAMTLLDVRVGGAVSDDDETPLFCRAIVYLAQDLSYCANRDLRGRNAALRRAGELFGEKARERLALDISLDADIVEIANRRARDKRIRSYIRSVSCANDLSEQIDLCGRRLALLESTHRGDPAMMTGFLRRRVEVLRTFTSLAATDLATRCARADVDTEALNAFCAWAGEG